MSGYAHNTKTIKNDNRALVLNLIRKAPISRAEISKVTGLSKSSVTIIINALISEGQIKEIGTGKSSVGRKRILLDIVSDIRFAAGIILHRHDIKVCLTDLKGEVLKCVSRPIDSFSSAGEIFDYTSETVFELIGQLSLCAENCIGIGISSPGPLDSVRGTILTPPHLNLLHNTPVVDEIEKRTGMTAVLENNAVLLAMRERMTRGKDMKNFISVVVWHGIGSAVVTGGEIYRGALGFAGELGHISVVAGGKKCPCGNSGCLERYVSLSALKERFSFSDYNKIVDLAYDGDKEAVEVMQYLTRYFGSGLVTAINLFDLDAVILHGDYSYRPKLLNAMLKDYIDTHSVVAATHNVEVISSSDRSERSDGNSTAAIIERYFGQMLGE